MRVCFCKFAPTNWQHDDHLIVVRLELSDAVTAAAVGIYSM